MQRVASGSPFEATIGFSRAVRVGDRVLVSGTAPVWPSGEVDPDVAVQTRRCLEIVGDALREAGAGLGDVVRTRMFLTDAADAGAVSAVHGDVFGDVRPAATMVVVSALLDPRWKVEIEAEAVTDRPTSMTTAEALALEGSGWSGDLDEMRDETGPVAL